MNPLVARARPAVQKLVPYASARAVAGEAPVMLNANERPWAPEQQPELCLNRYPSPQPDALVDALAGLYAVNREQLLVTRGSDEAIDLLTRAFCEAGQSSVLITPPTFGMYAIAAEIQGAEVLRVPLDEADQFALDTRALLDTVRDDTRLIFLCSPNNPTGSVLKAQQVRDIANAVAGKALVVLDEAYQEFCEQPSLAGAAGDIPNLAVLRTLSKAHGLAGARCGSLIADPAIIDLTRRVMPPYPLPTPSVAAALNALKAESLEAASRQVNILMELKQTLVADLVDRQWCENLWPGRANFVLLRVAQGWPDLANFAARRGILLRRFSDPDRSVRISVGSAGELERLYPLLDEYEARNEA